MSNNKTQQAYHALLQEQIAQKQATKKMESDRNARDALDREVLSQNKPSLTNPPTGKAGPRQDNGVLPLGSTQSRPTNQRSEARDMPPAYQEADMYSGKGNNYSAPKDTGYPPAGGMYDPYQDNESAQPMDDYMSPYQKGSAGQGARNPADEEELQRRMEEYYRENGLQGAPGSNPDLDYRSDMNPYGGPNDDIPQYSRGMGANPYEDQGNAYSSPKAQSDYQPPMMGNPYEQPAQPAQGRKRANDSQHNYLVNNPIAPDLPQKRASGGFRAHQDIRHEHMGVDRQAKLPLTQGNAKDAYNVIKKKYGNHSAQYNILTGN